MKNLLKKLKKETPKTEPSSWDRFKDAIHKIAPPKKAKENQVQIVAEDQ